MIIVSMFDESGNAVRDWATAGHTCYCFDIINTFRIEAFPSGGTITYLRADFFNLIDVLKVVALKPDFIMGFPDCTHLTVSGTRHWASKRAADPNFQHKAVWLARTVELVGTITGKPWMLENPPGALSTLWRKSDYRFDPCDYGWYLPADDVHPRWPEYIPSQDRYTKHTRIWAGNGFRMPVPLPIEPLIIRYENGVSGSPQFSKLGGKSAKTKQIRSEGPRGYLRAVFLANSY